MKKQLLLTRMLLLVALLVGSVSVWGQAAKDDVLWSEPFKGSASTSTTFSETTNWGNFLNPTTLVASDASSLSYTTSNAMASGVTTTEMSGTHVWLKKSADAYIQVTGIKLYNATKVKVSWAQSTGGSSTTVYYQFDGTGDFTALSTCSGPNANFESDELTVSNHTTIALRFFHPSSNSKNTRIDNLKLTATAVETASVTSLTVKTAPTKTRYEVGESLDMTGFALNADGNTVTSGYTMTMDEAAITNGATLNSAGKKTLVVSYGGKTVDQPISVGSVTGIAVTTPPTKTSYDTGDSFDATGMVVTATLNTGELESPDVWTKEVTGYTVDPEDNLAPANTYVTITYATKTATQNIKVTNVAVTGVSVKPSTTIEKGKTEDLSATVTPANATNKNVTWESDNTAVATVDENTGVVTAVAAGTANITVTTEDGGKTATCVVTVVNQKGTIDAPYTVAEVEATSGSLTNKYVTGYVVGYAENSKHFPYGNNAANSNLTLADSPDISININGTPTSSNSDGLIAIKLTNQFQTNYGLGYNNGALIGEKIIVKGEINDYFTGRGVKTTNVVITDKSYTTSEAISSTSSIPNYSEDTNTIYYVGSGSTITGASNVVKETTAGVCTADEIKITEGIALNIPTDITASKITNSRTLAADADAYTWYEPYAYTLPEGNVAYTFTGANGTALTFTELGSQTLAANTPYLIVAKDAVNGSVNSSTVVKATPTTNTSGGTQGNWQFVGTYKTMTATEAEAANMWALGAGNKWYYYTGSDTYGVYPRRAYMINSADKANEAKQFDTTFGEAANEATHIELVNKQNPDESRIYTLDGKYVGTKKEVLNGGIYVKDGKKFIIK